MADSVEAAEVAELVELREPNLSEERQEEVQTIPDVLKAPSANSTTGHKKPAFLQKFKFSEVWPKIVISPLAHDTTPLRYFTITVKILARYCL